MTDKREIRNGKNVMEEYLRKGSLKEPFHVLRTVSRIIRMTAAAAATARVRLPEGMNGPDVMTGWAGCEVKTVSTR